ncbi:hypothetical protein M514_04961 [Trichuris suis]|uniref:Uncharacterized protein n=1 Tax=Trichuris suis TaxID=68888 RepID=A0A085NNZ5_9BILA|nr:hypothetical protein M513_04961 [Trichuris suis]KFD71191.1 hypothetical protein M514_04961 [Trichuris suis]
MNLKAAKSYGRRWIVQLQCVLTSRNLQNHYTSIMMQCFGVLDMAFLKFYSWLVFLVVLRIAFSTDDIEPEGLTYTTNANDSVLLWPSEPDEDIETKRKRLATYLYIGSTAFFLLMITLFVRWLIKKRRKLAEKDINENATSDDGEDGVGRNFGSL